MSDNKQASQPTTKAKKPYKAPTITTYGKISELTKGSSGTQDDGGATFQPVAP